MSNNNFPSLPPLPPRPQLPNSGGVQPAIPPTQQPVVQPQTPPAFYYDTQEPQQQSLTPAQPNPTKSKKPLFIILAIVGVVILVVAVAFVFLNPFASKGGVSSGNNPSQTTTYVQDPEITSAQPLNPENVALERPSFQGYDGGTTYISFSDDTAWEGGQDADNEDLLQGNYDALYRGIGACTIVVNVVSDSLSDEVRWSAPENKEMNEQVFLANFFNTTVDPSSLLKINDVQFPSHADGKGQIPGYAYRIPAEHTGQLADTYATLMYDYNTGRATIIGVACLTSEDSLGVFGEMTSKDNKFSVYVDVK